VWQWGKKDNGTVIQTPVNKIHEKDVNSVARSMGQRK